MRELLLAAAFGLALTGSAQATVGFVCDDGHDASISVGIGTVPGMSIVSTNIDIGEVHLSLMEGDLSVSQAFSDAESIRIDFTDMQAMELLASLRLFRAQEGDDYVMAGTLTVTDVGAFAVVCEGP